jgi:hypothetical protein
MSRFNNQPAKALDFIKSITSRVTQLDREGGLTRDEMSMLLEAESLVATGLKEWSERVEDVNKLNAKVAELEKLLEPGEEAKKPK